jgi:alkanesulfonate monooxygenase SsuD/methylene tetrahydromethanopterin reductase-like flavin-dependent oxidoreductase (luciferase family)
LLGFGLPVSGAWATPEAMVRFARRAEELGYASLWTFQRLLYPVRAELGPMYRSVHDPLISLAYVAGVTQRIRLGLAIVNAPFYAPLVLAKQLTTLDVVSGGRLDAGLGLGWSREEFAAAGVSLDRRGARMEEYVACLRAIWSEDPVRFDGTFYSVPEAHVHRRRSSVRTRRSCSGAGPSRPCAASAASPTDGSREAGRTSRRSARPCGPYGPQRRKPAGTPQRSASSCGASRASTRNATPTVSGRCSQVPPSCCVATSSG